MTTRINFFFKKSAFWGNLKGVHQCKSFAKAEAPIRIIKENSVIFAEVLLTHVSSATESKISILN